MKLQCRGAFQSYYEGASVLWWHPSLRMRYPHDASFLGLKYPMASQSWSVWVLLCWFQRTVFSQGNSLLSNLGKPCVSKMFTAARWFQKSSCKKKIKLIECFHLSCFIYVSLAYSLYDNTILGIKCGQNLSCNILFSHLLDVETTKTLKLAETGSKLLKIMEFNGNTTWQPSELTSG